MLLRQRKQRPRFKIESARIKSSDMADNYLEKRYQEYLEKKAAAEKAKRAAWKKRMDAYRKKLAEGK